MVSGHAIDSRMRSGTLSRPHDQASRRRGAPLPKYLQRSGGHGKRSFAESQYPDWAATLRDFLEPPCQSRTWRNGVCGRRVEVRQQIPGLEGGVLGQGSALVKKFTKCYGRKEFNVVLSLPSLVCHLSKRSPWPAAIFSSFLGPPTCPTAFSGPCIGPW